MLHKKNDEYINSVQNYANSFKKNNFRKIACNDFKGWPDPLEETWRLSRLGALTRQNNRANYTRS